MTDTPPSEKRKAKKRKFPLSSAIIILLLTPAFLFPKEISDGVLHGLRLCVTNVIPSVFPFLIIADAIYSLSEGDGAGVFSRIFSRFFSLPPIAASVFFCGCVCGFPIGVKMTSELYERGILKKGQAEYIIGFSNNPSVAFVTSAVGLGMFGSFGVGILIYFVIVLSALAVGVIFKQNGQKQENNYIIIRQKFNFVDSVKNAGYSSITISSYIIFFSALSGLLLHVLGNGILGLLGCMLSEVSGGVLHICASPLFGRKIALILTAVTLGFSGFSVHLQARSIASKKLSFAKYYLMKTVQGILAGAIVTPFALMMF